MITQKDLQRIRKVQSAYNRRKNAKLWSLHLNIIDKYRIGVKLIRTYLNGDYNKRPYQDTKTKICYGNNTKLNKMPLRYGYNEHNS